MYRTMYESGMLLSSHVWAVGMSKRRTDPAVSLQLLWGQDVRPGRSGLTLRAIVDAATALADAEGLGALSMRRVAERLGTGTMSLYSYVPGKDELEGLMFDRLMGQLYADVDEPARQGGWRAAMQFVAARNWQLYLDHPWLSELQRPRPVLGPNVTLKYEAELRPLDGVGLSDVEMDTLLGAILTQVQSAAQAQAQQRRAQQDSAQTDQEWWLDRAPLLAQLMDARRFPVAARVGQAVGEQLQAAADPQLTLQFGLTMLLDGVEGLLAARRPD